MRERVQVQSPQGPEALQVSARPGAAVANPRRMGTSAGMQLAEALSSLEPSLRGHLKEAQVEYETKEAERAYDTLQGMTFDDAKRLVDSGTLRATENPWYEAAFMKQFGVSYAGQRKRDIMLTYETGFDKHNGDIEQFIAGHVREDAGKYGDNKFVAAGIREGMGDFLERLRDQHAEFRATNVRNTTVDQFYGAAMTVADEAMANGGDPSAAVRSLYEQHRQAFGMSYQQMDDNVMALAAKYAEEGNLEAVEALLKTDIVGADGQKVGSFLNRPRYAQDAQTILNKAQAQRADRNRELNTLDIVDIRTRAQSGQLTDADRTKLEGMKNSEQISQEMHESLLVQNQNARDGALVASHAHLQEANYKSHVTSMLVAGKAFGITDYTYTDPVTGKERTLKRDEVLQGVVNDTMTAMAQNGYSEPEMAGTMANWGTSATYQVWENALTDGYLALGQALAKADKDGNVQLPPAAMAAYGTWKNLGEYPNVRALHVKDQTALKVYRDAEALERGGMEPETALLAAAGVDRDATRNGLSTQINREELSDVVRRAVENGWGQDAENGGFVSSTIETTARILMDKGLPASRAVKEAERIFSESHTVINGVAVNTRNKLLPPNFGPMAEAVIEDFARMFDEDPSDLTLIPSLNGEQNWVIAHKGTLMPHEEWMNGGSITIRDMQDRFSEEAAKRASEKVQELNENLDRTANPTSRTKGRK